MAARRRRQDWSRPLGPSPSRFANQAYWSGVSITPPDTSMQAFGLSRIKGRLGSDQERREIQTSPERKTRPRPGFRARPKKQDGDRRRRGDRGRASAVLPWTDRITRTRRRLMRTTTRVFAVGDARRGPTGRQTSRRREPRTVIPSAPRSRQAMVVGGQTLVKAGLRPPPPAASALTRLRPPTSRAAREIEARERPSDPPPTPHRKERKKAPRPY
jgi:hypothetical protein